jgi:hypothetical protein
MVSMSNEVWLQTKFSSQDWFDSVGTDRQGRLVVYVKYLSFDILNAIPLDLMGGRVLVHLAASKAASATQFVNTVSRPTQTVVAPPVEVTPLEEESVEDTSGAIEVSVDELERELDRLERACGSNMLQDLFYEIHDGKNAVTNNSTRYPEVFASLKQLYDQYGFDVIYEELDG